MARKPEIFLRELDPDEAQRLVKIARTTKDRVRLRRAGMALASMQGRSVPQIAEMFAVKEETIRELIKTYNDRGFSPSTEKHAVGRRRGSAQRPVNRSPAPPSATRPGSAVRSQSGV